MTTNSFYFVNLWTFSLSFLLGLPDIPGDWKQFPLTETEISLIKASSSSGQIPIVNSQNQNCLLSPGVSAEGGRACTWRARRLCRQVPRSRSDPVFPPWCRDLGGGDQQRLGRCSEVLTRRPLLSSTRVCTPTGVPDCRGPCDGCEDYCEQVSQSWCDLSHSISTLVSEKRECDFNNAIGNCEEVIKRIEKDVVSSNENCYQKKAEICGPVNCKIVNITMVCEEKNSTVMVDLRQRECTVCQPSLEERLEVVDICDDVLTQDCQDDPLNPEPWTKFCDTNTSKVLNNGLTFKFEKSLPETIAVDLVQQSLGPINDLLADTAPSGTNTEDTIVVTTPRIKTSSKSRPRSQSETTEDVSEILKILTQKKTETRGSDNFYFGQTATSTPASRPVTGANWPSPSSSSSSVYFNPVLNTRPLPSQYQDTTQSSLTEFLNFQLQKQFSSPATPVRNSVTVMENQSSVKIKPSELITTTKSDKDEFTTPRIPVFEVETTAITSAKTMTSSKVLTTTTTTTGSVSLTTQKSQISETNESQSRVTLTPSEVIQLCFLNSSYCDFSKNEVLVSNRETTTALTTTSLATTLEMEIAVTRESTLLIAKQEDIKDRIRKCFLTGECGDIGQQRGSVDQRVVTTTETLISSTPSPRDAALRRRVKERARACLFEGKCN